MSEKCISQCPACGQDVRHEDSYLNHEIEGRQISVMDIGSKVTYVPPHAEGKAIHPDAQGGTIKSWNEYYIFIEFGTGTGQACIPRDLRWG